MPIADETQLAREALNTGKQAVQRAVQESGGVWGFTKGVLALPFNGLGGLGDGAWHWIKNYSLPMGAALGVVSYFRDSIVQPVMKAIGKPEWTPKILAALDTDNLPKLAATIAGTAVAGSAAIGGAVGAVQGGISGFTRPEEAPGVGSMVLGGLAIAAATVALGAVNKGDISLAGIGETLGIPSVPDKSADKAAGKGQA